MYCFGVCCQVGLAVLSKSIAGSSAELRKCVRASVGKRAMTFLNKRGNRLLRRAVTSVSSCSICPVNVWATLDSILELLAMEGFPKAKELIPVEVLTVSLA